MAGLMTKIEAQLLLMLSFIFFVNGEADCEDCCSIYNAHTGLFIGSLCQLNIVISAGFYIVLKNICKPEEKGQVWAITIIHLVLGLTMVIWYVIDRVIVDCDCCTDDRVQVILLLSLSCVLLVAGIFFNFYLSYKYRFWQHWCNCGKQSSCGSNNAQSYDATQNKA